MTIFVCGRNSCSHNVVLISSFSTYHGIFIKSNTQRVSLVEQKLLSFPDRSICLKFVLIKL